MLICSADKVTQLCIFFFIFFPIMVCNRMLNIVPCATVGPCCLSILCINQTVMFFQSAIGRTDIVDPPILKEQMRRKDKW